MWRMPQPNDIILTKKAKLTYTLVNPHTCGTHRGVSRVAPRPNDLILAKKAKVPYTLVNLLWLTHTHVGGRRGVNCVARVNLTKKTK